MNHKNKIEQIKNIIEKQFPKTIEVESIFENIPTLENNSANPIINSLNINSRIYIISIGKVGIKFANHFCKFLRKLDIHPQKVIVITDKKYLIKENSQDFEILFSTHPQLSLQTIQNTQKIIEFLRENDSKDSSFIFLISGGGSSIFESPLIPQELAIEIYKYLLNLDIDIQHVNTVRRFFSNVKSGKILQYIKKSQVISLILSDVPFNDLSTIASGITFLKKFTLYDIEYISQTLKPIIDHHIIHQTLRKNFEIFKIIETQNENLHNIHHLVLADNTFALKQLEKLFINQKFNVNSICSHLNLNQKKLVEIIKGIILTNKEQKDKLYLLGGETNLKVEKEGFGGRLQHLGLEILRQIKILENLKEVPPEKEIIFFALSTDGIDGKTSKSGFILSNKVKIEMEKIQKYLENYNSGLFFENPKYQKYSLILPPGINNLNEIYGIYFA